MAPTEWRDIEVKACMPAIQTHACEFLVANRRFVCMRHRVGWRGWLDSQVPHSKPRMPPAKTGDVHPSQLDMSPAKINGHNKTRVWQQTNDPQSLGNGYPYCFWRRPNRLAVGHQFPLARPDLVIELLCYPSLCTETHLWHDHTILIQFCVYTW